MKRGRHARNVLHVLLCLGLFTIAPGSVIDRSSAKDTAARSALTPLDSRVLDLTNAQRARKGLPQLRLEASLCQAAQWLANDMARHNYFSHKDRFGRTIAGRLRETGYEYRVAGENIARGQRSADEVVSDWLSSPGHRANMLSPRFAEIGLACVSDTGRRGLYWVQVFGTR